MKRVLSILLTVSLLYLIFPDVYAATFLRLSVMDVSTRAEAGTEVRVPVLACDGFRYAAGIVDVKWNPEALILKDVEFTENFAPDNGSAPVTNNGEYRVSVGDYNATKNYLGNGVFFTLIFEVAENAKAASYLIELTDTYFCDKDMKYVNVEHTNGSVLLSESGTLSLAVQSVTVSPDAESVLVPVAAERNDGYAAAVVDIIWNPEALILNSIAFNDTLAPDNATRAIDNSGEIRISFGSNEAYKDFTGCGTFFTLEFLLAENVSQGKYEIQLVNPDAVNGALLPLSFEAKSGTVLISEHPEPETTTTTAETTTKPVSKTTTTTAETTTKPVTKTTTFTETTTKPGSGTTTVPPFSETTSAVTTITQPATDGDYNGDGTVSVADVVLFARFIVEDSSLLQQQIQSFAVVKTDLNNDGMVTLIDIKVLVKIILNSP